MEEEEVRIRCRDARHGVISGRISGAGRGGVMLVVVGWSFVLFSIRVQELHKNISGGAPSHAVS